MTLAVGPITQNSVGPTTASLTCAAASGGTSPYTYQWYRSTTQGFSPGGGNIIAGATALTLEDSGLIPNTQYYYVVVVTDVGNSNATANSTEKAVATSAPTLNPNQFGMTEYLGVLDLRFNTNTVAAQIDAAETATLYAGAAVKMVDSADGVPKVLLCDDAGDDVFGFINFNFKNVAYVAGSACEVSLKGNVMYLYATEAIARGAQVQLDTATMGGVMTADVEDANIVGWAYDKATAAGQLIRVYIETPSFAYVPGA